MKTKINELIKLCTEQNEKNNLFIFICIDLLEFINENLRYNDFNDIDFIELYTNKLIDGSYNCNSYKNLKINQRYLNHIYYILNDLKDFDNYIFNSFSKLFFDNIEQFTVNFLDFVYKHFVLNTLDLDQIDKNQSNTDNFNDFYEKIENFINLTDFY